MGTRSTFRSRMTRTGLEVGVPAADDEGRACDEKRLSLELRMWSRSLRSSLAAIISAAAPLGHRICFVRRISMLPSKTPSRDARWLFPTKFGLWDLRRG